jgi:anthranilate synthase component 2
MFLVIDNYDSFTYNLVHYLGELGAKLDVVRNDKITVDEVLERDLQGVILSPGPCTPNEAGICVDLIKQAGPHMPIFGVCLGLQSIGQAYGGIVVRAPHLMHGKISNVKPFNRSVFMGINSPFQATRYHSLIVEKETLPKCLQVSAESDDGLIMGLVHRDYPIHGVQFHPESIASEHGHTILRNFLEIARIWNAVNRPAMVEAL